MKSLVVNIFTVFAVIASTVTANAVDVITVLPPRGDATATLRDAIDKATAFGGKPVIVRLTPGNYNLSRDEATPLLYHVSNTTSVEENPDPTKHIGLLLKNLENVTIDGNGAWLVTHGEMTTFVIDSCFNIKLTGFTVTAADPSVPEIKILAADSCSITFEVTHPSAFEVNDGHFHFKGCGWVCADGRRLTNLPEYAQVFYPERNVTNRCDSPLQGYNTARRLDDRTVMMTYDRAPEVHVGEVYQIRHGIRNEVCGLINRSKDITIDNVEFNFLGNFGIVGQFSENLTYNNIRCRPRLGSGRTDAGFADFVQMSGCKGLIRIAGSHFEGAHDDPVNIHGTHLQVVGADAPGELTVRYMHGQTYGFMPCVAGDNIEIVDRHTLNSVGDATVKQVIRIDDYTYRLVLSGPVTAISDGYSFSDLAIENVTWTPRVEIVDNYFARTPTRGILITTRGKSLIENNTFFRIPMYAILVSDDARGWYESGPVHDLTIRHNTFIECSNPVIGIWPEIDRFDKPVHCNITIEGNRFIMAGSGPVINVKASDSLTVKDNVFDYIGFEVPSTVAGLIELENVTNEKIENNRIVVTGY